MTRPAAPKPTPLANTVGVDRARRCDRCGQHMHYGKFVGGGRWHICAHCDRPECHCPDHRE